MSITLLPDLLANIDRVGAPFPDRENGLTLKPLSVMPNLCGDLKAMLREAVVVDAQVAHDVLQGKKVDYTGFCCKIPFPFMWFEYTALSNFSGERFRCGVLAVGVDDDPVEVGVSGASRVLTLPFRVERHLGANVYIGSAIATTFDISETGSIEQAFSHMPTTSESPEPQQMFGIVDEFDRYQTGLDRHAVVAINAITLMNCRNVQIIDGGNVNFKRTTRQKRRGELPPIRYKTILLPGMTTRRERGHTTAGTDAEIASHKVRGHFKTFTEERPLLGKHVGTYWWGWQMRGDKKHGTNINDYALAGDSQ